MLIKNGLVFTEQGKFEPITILTDGDRISMLLPAEAMLKGSPASADHRSEKHAKYAGEVIDASGCYVLPGLTDINFHGCAGHDFCEGTAEALDAITEYEFSQGVTSICPATMTLPDERLTEILRSCAKYTKAQTLGERAEIVGVHLEGPFISPIKKGAQKEEYIQTPSPEKLHRWQTAAGGLIKLVTVAPEMERAIECISECGKEFRFSLGHTECDYDTAIRAIEAGADHITHMYNAMSPFTHREPGVIGAAFDKGCYAELICDGVHVSPSAVRAAFRLFGDERMLLISDSMEETGKPEGEYELGGQRVHVRGNRAELDDGTIAGSVTPLYRCMLNAVDMGIPLESAVKAATINPCRSIGIDHDYGSISVSKKAHFLLLDRGDLRIRNVIR